jgi:hypothetical protein
MDNDEMDQKIESYRKKLIEVGMKEGLDSQDTIKISQSLDVMIKQKIMKSIFIKNDT